MKVSLWKSAGATGRQRQGGQSIRGKISAPIPIPNHADDVFSTSNMGTGIAVSHPSDSHEPASHPTPLPPSPPHPTHHHASPSLAGSQNGPTAVSGSFSEVSHTRPLGSNHSPPRSVRPRSSSGPSPTSGLASNSPPRRTANPSSQIRYSVVSGSSQRTGNISNRDIPQRKKSTIRGALSKLFGRRKKHGSQSSAPGEMGAIASTQHRSDPSALNRFGKDGEPKRSASLPITEYDRALRSHSVGPQDITAIESTRNSLQADFNLTRRRAATTSSQLYAPIRVRDGELVGLSPRPASSHARTSRILGPADDPSQIGWAITSDNVAGRRRSRSLSGLRGMGEARSGEVRRRSDEIRYWRQSYDPAFMSPISSNAPECDDAGVVMADAATGTDRPATPPEPFNFGSLATMREMAGMKITQAANMETRILDLEARMLRMEGVMIQLCNTVPGFQAQSRALQSTTTLPSASEASLTHIGSAAPPNVSIHDTAPQDERIPTGYSTSGHSGNTASSLAEVPTFIGSLPVSVSGGGGQHVPVDRPTSNVTIRGAGSPAVVPGDRSHPFSADHYATLLSLMETERSTRRALESRVKKLSRTVQMLAMQTGRPIELEPPPTARSFGGQSAFDDDDSTEDDDDETEGDEEASSLTVPPKSNMRSLNLQDSGVATGPEDTDDDNPSESFATPREERAHGFGAFGEALREEDDDGTRKRAARTLSLSQLTGGVGHGKLEVV